MANTDWQPQVRAVAGQEQRFAYIRSLMAERRFDEASAELEGLLQERPNSRMALLGYGVLLQRQRRFKESLPYFERVMAIAPNNAQGPLFAGYSGLACNELGYAEANFRKAGRINPLAPEPHMGLARLYLSKGDIDGAEASFKNALAIDPQSARARIGLARLYVRKQDAAGAAAELGRAVNAHPGNPGAALMLARLQNDAGDLVAAQATLEAAVTANPDRLRLLAALGAARSARGDHAGAEAVYRKALSQSRRGDQFRLRIASELVHLGKLDEARQMLSAVRRSARTGSAIQRLYGDIFAAEKKHVEAEEAYRAALLTMPNSEELIRAIDAGRPAAAAAGPEQVLALYRSAMEQRANDIRARMRDPAQREAARQKLREAREQRRAAGVGQAVQA